MNSVSESILKELDFFAVSFLLGILLMLVYDFLRIFRQVTRHGSTWIALEDLSYWVMVAFVSFSMLYQKNDGLIRGFAIGGIVLGMLLYNQFISRHTVPHIVWILKKIIHMAGRFCNFLLGPFRKAKKKAAAKAGVLHHKEKKIKKYVKKQLKKIRNEVKIGISKK